MVNNKVKKKIRKKKAAVRFPLYQQPFVADDKTGGNSTIGTKSGGALTLGKPNIK